MVSQEFPTYFLDIIVSQKKKYIEKHMWENNTAVNVMLTSYPNMVI